MAFYFSFDDQIEKFLKHYENINAEKTERERILLEKNMKLYKERVKSLIETQLRIAEDLDKIEL